MIELHGWLTIRPTYMDEDRHPEIDEDRIYNEFRVLVIKRGTCEWKANSFLSPCIPVIEDFLERQ